MSSSTNPFSHMAHALREREIAVRFCEHLMREGSDLYDTQTHEAAIEAYREALLGLIASANEQLSLLPERPKTAEKSAGYVSPSIHG